MSYVGVLDVKSKLHVSVPFGDIRQIINWYKPIRLKHNQIIFIYYVNNV